MFLAIVFSWVLLLEKTGLAKGRVLPEYTPMSRSSEEVSLRSGLGNDLLPLSGSPVALKLLSELPARYFNDRSMQYPDGYASKRSWKSLNGSWGKRDASSTLDEADVARWLANVESDYDDRDDVMQKISNYLPINDVRDKYLLPMQAKEKRKSWNAMKAAWGKRSSKYGGSDWSNIHEDA